MALDDMQLLGLAEGTERGPGRLFDDGDDMEDFEALGEGSQPSHSAEHLSKLLRIRRMVEDLTPPVPLNNAPEGVTSLGDATPDEGVRRAPRKRDGVTEQLVRLDRLVQAFDDERSSESQLDLGEIARREKAAGDAAVDGRIAKDSFDKEDYVRRKVDSVALHRLMNIASDQDSAAVVQRVVSYLEGKLRDGYALTREELDEVRQFYIDQTANVLARFGYEDSPYGEKDVSERRGDAVAARNHMDDEDTRLHMASQKDPNHIFGHSKRVGRVLNYLKDTEKLSEFLSRLTLVSAEAAPRHSLSAPHDRLTNLARLQRDEEKITDGIELLLKKIRGDGDEDDDSFPGADRSDNSAHGLQKRASAESDRLAGLQHSLSSSPSAATDATAKPKEEAEPKEETVTKVAKAKPKKEEAAPSNKEAAPSNKDDNESVQVSVPRLKDQLNVEITNELDRTLKRFRNMEYHGHYISPEAKRQVNMLLHLITAHLLKTYLTYREWFDKGAVAEEAHAIKEGDAEAPSRLQGQHMSSKRVVESYLANVWHHQPAKPVHIPKIVSVHALMGQGINLPNGGHIKLVLKQP